MYLVGGIKNSYKIRNKNTIRSNLKNGQKSNQQKLYCRYTYPFCWIAVAIFSRCEPANMLFTIACSRSPKCCNVHGGMAAFAVATGVDTLDGGLECQTYLGVFKNKFRSKIPAITGLILLGLVFLLQDFLN